MSILPPLLGDNLERIENLILEVWRENLSECLQSFVTLNLNRMSQSLG